MSDSAQAVPPRPRVLVLDDDEMICLLLQRSLERLGYSVVTETSPQDALALLATEDFDVVVSDLNMAGIDGLSFTQRVVALKSDTPVIVITGSATMESAINAIHAGAWDFIAKPIDPKLLVVSMNRACQHRALKKELRALRRLASEGSPTQAAVPAC